MFALDYCAPAMWISYQKVDAVLLHMSAHTHVYIFSLPTYIGTGKKSGMI